ncbi:hypothetical protein [Alicyclobacillus sp.]|uniref:hypothetical protein n=1 Tax=Alicyclobacillus sp. TaxID=61169 RepID=UPI0025BD93E5|nr:hypothetical protein [Alicyclobacillus sp.]MCL6517131.1 DUF3450 domain-containing protein [Alicyclobacillus sp.]
MPGFDRFKWIPMIVRAYNRAVQVTQAQRQGLAGPPAGQGYGPGAGADTEPRPRGGARPRRAPAVTPDAIDRPDRNRSRPHGALRAQPPLRHRPAPRRQLGSAAANRGGGQPAHRPGASGTDPGRGSRFVTPPTPAASRQVPSANPGRREMERQNPAAQRPREKPMQSAGTRRVPMRALNAAPVTAAAYQRVLQELREAREKLARLEAIHEQLTQMHADLQARLAEVLQRVDGASARAQAVHPAAGLSQGPSGSSLPSPNPAGPTGAHGRPPGDPGA